MTDILLDSIREIGKALQEVTRRAHSTYAVEVEALIREGCLDSQRIERTLDGLLDFCHDPEILKLYKRLCRYYFPMDSEGAVFYVNAYRRMWDSEETNTDRESIMDFIKIPNKGLIPSYE